jgi:hypothetical protein
MGLLQDARHRTPKEEQMSVNYYLDSPDNEVGHIGKWGGGYFTAKAPEGVDSFADWKAMLQGHRIFAEHGVEYTPDEMVEITRPERRYGRANLRRPQRQQGEWIEQGVLFVRHDFC